MLITESQMGYYGNNGLNLGLQLLNEMYYLDAEQSAYTPAMVPVVENSDLGRVIIRLEDLENFCEANGISDMGYAIHLICEADNIDPSYIGFSIAENTILSDPDLADLSAELLNEGMCVVATPVNEDDAACLAVDMAVEQMLSEGSTVMLEALAYDDYYTFFNEADDEDPLKGKIGSFGKDYGNDADYMWTTANARAERAHEYRVKQREGKTAGGKKMEGLKKIWDKVKSGVNISRDWIAKQIGRLQKWMADLAQRKHAMGKDKRNIIDTIQMHIARVLEFLSRKLHDIIQVNRGKISSMYKGTGYGAHAGLYGFDDNEASLNDEEIDKRIAKYKKNN